MQKGIIGKKIGMTQLFDENGKVIPVTVVEAGPCVVVAEEDRRKRRLRSCADRLRRHLKAHKVNKPMKGHFAKADVAPKKNAARVPLWTTSTLTT